MVIIRNFFERVEIRLQELYPNIVQSVLEMFYKAQKTKFLRDRIYQSSLNIFQSLYNLLALILSTFKDLMSYFEYNEILTNLTSQNMVQYFFVCKGFWNIMTNIKKHYGIVVEPENIDGTIREKYLEQIKQINQGYRRGIDEDPFNRVKHQIFNKYTKILENKGFASTRSQLEVDDWKSAIPDFNFQEELQYLLEFKLNQESRSMMEGASLLPETNRMLLDDYGIENDPEEENMILNGIESTRRDPQDFKDSQRTSRKKTALLLINREIHYKNNKYLVSKSFCKFIHAFYSYLKIYNLSDSLELDKSLLKNILNLVSLYKSTTTQLILSGGSVICKTIEKVENKMLSKSRFLI